MICSFNFLIFLAVCLNISTIIYIKILTNSNQQTQSYKFTSHTTAFLSVVLITEILEICIQTSYDQNVQLILKSYLPVVYGTPLRGIWLKKTDGQTKEEWIKISSIFIRMKEKFADNKEVTRNYNSIKDKKYNVKRKMTKGQWSTTHNMEN